MGAVLAAEAGRSSPRDLLRLFEALPEGALACHLVTGIGLDPVDGFGARAEPADAINARRGL